MGILDLAKRDIEQITTNLDGFAVNMTFVTPDEQTTAEIKGTTAKHNLGFDTEGLPVSEINANVSVSEETFIKAGYPVRDGDNRVSLLNHRVTVKDSSGADNDFVVREQFPDETIGLIVLVLNYRE
jgi:hypothetical protein